MQLLWKKRKQPQIIIRFLSALCTLPIPFNLDLSGLRRDPSVHPLEFHQRRMYLSTSNLVVRLPARGWEGFGEVADMIKAEPGYHSVGRAKG